MLQSDTRVNVLLTQKGVFIYSPPHLYQRLKLQFKLVMGLESTMNIRTNMNNPEKFQVERLKYEGEGDRIGMYFTLLKSMNTKLTKDKNNLLILLDPYLTPTRPRLDPYSIPTRLLIEP